MPSRAALRVVTTLPVLIAVLAAAACSEAAEPATGLEPRVAQAVQPQVQSAALSPTDAARRDQPRPPDRCSYAAREGDWPPADETRGCLRYNGTGKTVLLIGDSHAEHWAPAFTRMARLHNWHFLTLTRAKCDPLDLVVVRPSDAGHPTVGEACHAWKMVAYPTVIKRYDPSLVLVAGHSQHHPLRVGDRVVQLSSDDWMPTWRQSWRWTVRTLTAGGAKLGALTLQPDMTTDVPDCLDQYGLRTTRCDMPLRHDRYTWRTNRFILAIHSRYSRAWSVRVNARLCPDRICEAVIGDLITHADETHVTGRFSRSLAVPIYRMLRDQRLLRSGG